MAKPLDLNEENERGLNALYLLFVIYCNCTWNLWIYFIEVKTISKITFASIFLVFRISKKQIQMNPNCTALAMTSMMSFRVLINRNADKHQLHSVKCIFLLSRKLLWNNFYVIYLKINKETLTRYNQTFLK